MYRHIACLFFIISISLNVAYSDTKVRPESAIINFARRSGLSISTKGIPSGCSGKNKNVNSVSMVWIGGGIPEKAANNVKDLCDRNQVQDKKTELIIWNDWSDSDLSTKALEVDKVSDNCKSKNIDVVYRNINKNLFTKNSQTFKKGFEFYKEKKQWAAATDLLRPLMLKESGGCYIDFGFKYPEGGLPEFIESDLGLMSDDLKKMIPQGNNGDNIAEFTGIVGGGDGDYRSVSNKSGFLRGKTDSQHVYMNNGFMKANDKAADILVNSYEKNIKLLIDNPILQHHFKVDEKKFLSLKGPLFHATGPFAHTRAMIDIGKKGGRVLESIFEPTDVALGGSASWKREFEKLSNGQNLFHRLVLGICTHYASGKTFPSTYQCFEKPIRYHRNLKANQYDGTRRKSVMEVAIEEDSMQLNFRLRQLDSCQYAEWSEHIRQITDISDEREKKFQNDKVNEVNSFIKNFKSSNVYKNSDPCMEKFTEKFIKKNVIHKVIEVEGPTSRYSNCKAGMELRDVKTCLTTAVKHKKRLGRTGGFKLTCTCYNGEGDQVTSFMKNYIPSKSERKLMCGS